MKPDDVIRTINSNHQMKVLVLITILVIESGISIPISEGDFSSSLGQPNFTFKTEQRDNPQLLNLRWYDGSLSTPTNRGTSNVRFGVDIR